MDSFDTMKKLAEFGKQFDEVNQKLQGQTYKGLTGHVEATADANMVIRQLDIDFDIPQEVGDEIIIAVNEALARAKEDLEYHLQQVKI